jgi:lipoprotein NlpI
VVLAAADDASPRRKQQQACEANYYTGELALKQGKADEAKRLFALVAADCRKSLTAYAGASAEFKVLGVQDADPTHVLECRLLARGCRFQDVCSHG